MGSSEEVADILPTQAIVVLGCPVRAGGVPSPALERRVRGAVHLYDQGVAEVIVMSGGPGRHGVEAHAMRDLAVTLGVPSPAIQLEVESRSTRENARFTARLELRRVVVVSDAFHLPRARALFLEHFDEVQVYGVRGPGHRKHVAREQVIRVLTTAAAVLQRARSLRSSTA
ncbi:MAG: YdcF family protein [Proteobacteria bacterium]|nr:YdcF family protein [Pseudomonadota bacterium]MCP4921349.1 YdcF family protein [Pseudomonadota bacterium]